MTISAQLTASLAQDIQEIGFVYSTSSVNPTIADTKQESPGISYPVTSRVFDLNTGPAFTCNSTVYYRGYASSSNSDCELVYGPVSNATTLGCEPIPPASYWFTSNYKVDQTADDWKKRPGSEGGKKGEKGDIADRQCVETCRHRKGGKKGDQERGKRGDRVQEEKKKKGEG